MMLKEFPKDKLEKWIKTLRKRGFSYRQIQKYFELEGYEKPSLGFISSVFKNNKK
jgi:hypothetical protein